MIDIDHEHVMARLLTGTLAPGEREAIEDRLAADPAYFDAMCALEDEMIRDWHRNELSAEARQTIADAYLASPARRARMASGKLLIDAIDEWKRDDDVRAAWRTRVREWLAAPRPVPHVAFAVAAALVIAALPVALYEMRDGVRPQPITVVVPLSPVGERGRDAVQRANDVRIPRDAADVQLRFEIPDPGDTAHVDAIVESLDRESPVAAYPVRLEPTASLVLATVRIASDGLLDGDYVIKLRRMRRDGLVDIIATRTFRVVRQ